MQIPFSEIVITQKGKNPIIKSNKKLSNYIPYIDIKAFEQGIFDTYTDGQKCLLCDDGDVLLVWDGARAGLVGTAYKGAVGSTLMKVNVPYLERKYILFFIQLYSRELNAQPKGTGIPHINPNIFNSLPFFLPPLQEQNRIVTKIDTLFSELDSNITLLKNVKNQLAIYRQSVLKWAFEGKLTEEIRIKEDKSNIYKELLNNCLVNISSQIDYNNINLNIPDEWLWVKLGEIYPIEVGATPSRKNIKYWNGDIDWISSGEVKFCEIFNSKEKISKLGLENSSTNVQPPGTVLLAMIGEGKTRGQAAIIKIFAAHNQNTAAIIIPKTIYPPEYIYYYLLYNYQNTRKVGSGNNQKALNKERIKNIPFPFTSKPEQLAIISAIESRLSVCDKIEQTIDQTLALSDQLRQSILKKAFEGRLVPQDPNDEPAEKLLERIKSEKTAILEKQKTGHRMKRIKTNKKGLSNKANDKEKINST